MQLILRNIVFRVAVRKVTAALCLSIPALLFGVQSAPAQETGSIQGKVNDPSDALIFGAAVSVETAVIRVRR